MLTYSILSLNIVTINGAQMCINLNLFIEFNLMPFRALSGLCTLTSASLQTTTTWTTAYCSHLPYWSQRRERSLNPVWAWLSRPQKLSKVRRYKTTIALLPPRTGCIPAAFTAQPPPRAVSHASAVASLFLIRGFKAFPLGFQWLSGPKCLIGCWKSQALCTRSVNHNTSAY